MNSATLLKSFILFALLSMFSVASQAEERPSYRPDDNRSVAYPQHYPDGFQRKGIIRVLGRGKSSMVIDGRRYHYNISLKVNKPEKGTAGTLDLKVGQPVGFSFEEKKGALHITEIWILPANDHSGS